MKLVSMRRRKKRKGLGLQEKAVGLDEEPYPWGLRITLEKMELGKLDMAPKDFELGSRVAIQAEAEVIGISESELRGEGKTQRVELQIVRIATKKGKG